MRRSCSQAVEIPAGHTLNFRSSFVLLSGLLLHRRPADVAMNGGHPQTSLLGTPGIHNAPTDQSASYSSLSRLKVHQIFALMGRWTRHCLVCVLCHILRQRKFPFCISPAAEVSTVKMCLSKPSQDMQLLIGAIGSTSPNS